MKTPSSNASSRTRPWTRSCSRTSFKKSSETRQAARSHALFDGALSTSGSDFEHECRLLMPGGAIKDLRVRAHALHDSSGHIEFVGAVSDITARKAVDEQLREQELELRQILDLTPQLISAYGPNYERFYVNRVALD